MKSYNSFIGIDIGKFNFVVALHGSKTTRAYDNNPSGFAEFIKDFRKELPKSLCVLETTGGYEMRLLLTLCESHYSVHRANTRKVKNFIRSFGNETKTDTLDAKALAFYGFERSEMLEKFVPQTEQSYELYELIQRRLDLKQMLVAEKNRLKSPRTRGIVKTSVENVIKMLEEQLESIKKQINELIEGDIELKDKKKVLKTIPGIGDVIANELLTLLPELGQMNRREVASIAGVAPIARDSGKMKGYRHTGKGRAILKPTLFMAAMSARNSNSELKIFYENLVARGKKKMVALVALMRKIVVIANAKLKELMKGKVKLLHQVS